MLEHGVDVAIWMLGTWRVKGITIPVETQRSADLFKGFLICKKVSDAQVKCWGENFSVNGLRMSQEFENEFTGPHILSLQTSICTTCFNVEDSPLTPIIGATGHIDGILGEYPRIVFSNEANMIDVSKYLYA